MAKKEELKQLKEVEPLGEYIARIERAAQPLAVSQVSHPHAVEGAIYQGTYAGIRQVKGDLGAVLSDGSKVSTQVF